MKNSTVKSILFSLLAIVIITVFMPSCNSGNNNNSTTCSISGLSTVNEGTTVTLSYASDLVNPSVEWSPLGNITLISGQGMSTATFMVNGSGSVIASGEDGVLNCSEAHTITAITPAPACEKHVADIRAELDPACFINIWDAAYPGNDGCGPYTYEWEVEGICPGNTMPFENTYSTGFHSQFHNGSNNFTVYLTVTNDAGSQVAPYRIFNLYEPGCGMQECDPCVACVQAFPPTVAQTSPDGQTLIFNANIDTNSGACSYDGNQTWDYGDGTSGTSNTHTYLTPGTYEVCLSTTSYTNDGTECVDTACSNIGVGT